jgi:hypothetical protein
MPSWSTAWPSPPWCKVVLTTSTGSVLANGQTYRLRQSAKQGIFRVGDTVAIEYSADANGLRSLPW